jgi:hypothetical protein
MTFTDVEKDRAIFIFRVKVSYKLPEDLSV